MQNDIYAEVKDKSVKYDKETHQMVFVKKEE